MRPLCRESATTVACLVAAFSISATATPTALLYRRAEGPNALAKQKGKWFGSAWDSKISSDATVQKYYDDASFIGEITPENSMKPQSIDKGGGQYDFTGGDAVVAQAKKIGAKVRCHFLTGPDQNGASLGSISGREQTLAYLDKYIKAVTDHFGSSCYSWDVVNEALTQSGTIRSDVPWTSKIGSDFVVEVFKIASKYAPADTKLCYNDFNLESSQAKLTGAVDLAKKIKAAGARIDCIGFESHLSGSGPSQQSYESSLNQAAAVVAETPLTELDVSGASEQQQATAYATATKACANVKSCPGVTVWGISDKHSWRPGSDILDNSGREKAAVQSVISALASTGTTFSGGSSSTTNTSITNTSSSNTDSTKYNPTNPTNATTPTTSMNATTPYNPGTVVTKNPSNSTGYSSQNQFNRPTWGQNGTLYNNTSPFSPYSSNGGASNANGGHTTGPTYGSPPSPSGQVFPFNTTQGGSGTRTYQDSAHRPGGGVGGGNGGMPQFYNSFKPPQMATNVGGNHGHSGRRCRKNTTEAQ